MTTRLRRREFVGGAVKLALASALLPAEAAAGAGRAAKRRTLGAAIDTIIPAEGRMPAVSAVNGVAYLEALARKDAAFGALLTSGLRALEARSRESARRGFTDAPAAQRALALAHLETTDAPAGFVAALRDAVYEAYYSNPDVWKLIGYRFRSGKRRTATLEPFDPEKVARVRRMGRLYRETT